MKITKSQLQQIILEEYIKEEALEEALSQEQEEEVLAWIRKEGPRPDWLGDDYGHSKKGASTPADPNVDRGAETRPMDIPSDDAAESEYSGFQDRMGPGDTPDSEEMSDEDIVSSIARIIQGKDPETVQALFQTAFEQISGVEMSTPDEEEDLSTLYTPGAEGRPQAGFLEELMAIVREVLTEEQENA